MSVGILYNQDIIRLEIYFRDMPGGILLLGCSSKPFNCLLMSSAPRLSSRFYILQSLQFQGSIWICHRIQWRSPVQLILFTFNSSNGPKKALSSSKMRQLIATTNSLAVLLRNINLLLHFKAALRKNICEK